MISADDFRRAAAELQNTTTPMITGDISKPPDHDYPLPPTGVAALEQANKFIYAENMPTVDSDGWVTYTYGRGIPVIVASPLHLVTVRLEKGEVVLPESSELVGDPDIRVLPRTFGSGDDQQTFVLIKPKNAGSLPTSRSEQSTALRSSRDCETLRLHTSRCLRIPRR